MEILRSEFRAMACVNEIVIAAANAAEGRPALQAAAEEVLRIEAKFSRYRADSVVSEINAAAGSGTRVGIDAETRSLLAFADTLYRESEGLFDVTSGILRRVWHFAEPALPTADELAEVLALVGWSRVEHDDSGIRLPQAGMAAVGGRRVGIADMSHRHALHAQRVGDELAMAVRGVGLGAHQRNAQTLRASNQTPQQVAEGGRRHVLGVGLKRRFSQRAVRGVSLRTA